MIVGAQRRCALREARGDFILDPAGLVRGMTN